MAKDSPWWYRVSLDWYDPDEAESKRMNHITYGTWDEVWERIFDYYEENEVDNITIKSIALDCGPMLDVNEELMKILEEIKNGK